MAGLRERIKFLFTGRAPQTVDPSGGMQARIDAAQTTDENKRHWAQADALSADAAYDPGTRFRLRNRSRYETVNNCYAKGAVKASADDLIGTGPRLQLTIPGDDDGEAARLVEGNFKAWADETKLAIKLRTAQKSRVRDGECFGIFDTNERLRNPVKFDTRWVEAEMCTTPFAFGNNPLMIDGIRFDRLGNPIEYFFLYSHPGSLIPMGIVPLKYYTLPAERVVHWYSLERFGQHRAIPEITPALPLYSQLRRYSLATLTAAEFAAMLAGIMKTRGLPDSGTAAPVAQWEMFEMVRGALMTLPDGWEATQFKAEQPTTTYPEFKREILNESGRATSQPLNVVTGNSSGYNYSSGRLDHLPYHRSLRIERNDLRLLVLDPILRDGWYPEAVMVGQVPGNLPPIEQWSWCWNWDGFDSIDQNKDAQADDMRIKNGTSTYAEILAEYGQDWQEVFDQLAREKAYAQKRGLPWPVLSPSGAAGSAGDKPGGNQDQQPIGSLEQMVQHAMDEAGVEEEQAHAILQDLAPTFARMRGVRAPSQNGHSRILRG